MKKAAKVQSKHWKKENFDQELFIKTQLDDKKIFFLFGSRITKSAHFLCSTLVYGCWLQIDLQHNTLFSSTHDFMILLLRKYPTSCV